mgnify:CR=1 FL=1
MIKNTVVAGTGRHFPHVRLRLPSICHGMGSYPAVSSEA